MGVCNLGRDFLCTSVSHLRVAEDAISALLLLFIMIILLITIYRFVKEGPLVGGLWSVVIGLVPFFVWKFLGLFRRIFLEKSHFLYAPLHDFGEVLEALSALFILASFVYLYFLFKRKK